MPALDRRIVVRRTVTTRNQFGESVETIVDYPQWATREDASQADKEMAGGIAHASLRGPTSCGIERSLPRRSQASCP